MTGCAHGENTVRLPILGGDGTRAVMGRHELAARGTLSMDRHCAPLVCGRRAQLGTGRGERRRNGGLLVGVAGGRHGGLWWEWLGLRGYVRTTVFAHAELVSVYPHLLGTLWGHELLGRRGGCGRHELVEERGADETGRDGGLLWTEMETCVAGRGASGEGGRGGHGWCGEELRGGLHGRRVARSSWRGGRVGGWL